MASKALRLEMTVSGELMATSNSRSVANRLSFSCGANGNGEGKRRGRLAGPYVSLRRYHLFFRTASWSVKAPKLNLLQPYALVRYKSQHSENFPEIIGKKNRLVSEEIPYTKLGTQELSKISLLFFYRANEVKCTAAQSHTKSCHKQSTAPP